MGCNSLGKGLLAKGIEPSTVRLQVGRSTIELHQQMMFAKVKF